MRCAGLVAILFAGCAATAMRGRTATDPCSATVELYAWMDLPRDDERSHGLSGIAWDDRAHLLYAVSDRVPAIEVLAPDAEYRRFSFRDSIPIRVDRAWDAEAIAFGGDRFFIGNEAGPRVHIVDLRGKVIGEVPLPEPFTRSRHNAGLESTALSPDRRFLFVANEHAFEGDGPMGDAHEGTPLRIVRIELQTGAASERRYLTDPVFSDAEGGGVGVSDIVALSAGMLLVTERTYVPGHGNSVRTYCVPFEGTADKRLFLDFASLPEAGFPESLGPQRNRLLENYEGLALGPTLPNGRRLLFAVSDDNGSRKQTARLLVLATRGL